MGCAVCGDTPRMREASPRRSSSSRNTCFTRADEVRLVLVVQHLVSLSLSNSDYPNWIITYNRACPAVAAA